MTGVPSRVCGERGGRDPCHTRLAAARDWQQVARLAAALGETKSDSARERGAHGASTVTRGREGDGGPAGGRRESGSRAPPQSGLQHPLLRNPPAGRGSSRALGRRLRGRTRTGSGATAEGEWGGGRDRAEPAPAGRGHWLWAGGGCGRGDWGCGRSSRRGWRAAT
jgi:hypothetical protein